MIDNSKTINFRIGQRIRHLRKKLKCSGTVFAKRLEISQQQLSRYERGTNRISIELIYRISEKFDVHISYFYKVIIYLALNNTEKLKKKIIN